MNSNPARRNASLSKTTLFHVHQLQIATLLSFFGLNFVQLVFSFGYFSHASVKNAWFGDNNLLHWFPYQNRSFLYH